MSTSRINRKSFKLGTVHCTVKSKLVIVGGPFVHMYIYIYTFVHMIAGVGGLSPVNVRVIACSEALKCYYFL